MGFDDMVLVSPRDPKALTREKTIHGASGAKDILEKARVVSSLEEALEGVNHWCATAMPNDMSLERPKWQFQAPRRHFENLLAGRTLVGQRSSIDTSKETETNHQKQTEIIAGIPKTNEEIRVAFLFGNERKGMQDDDIRKCHVVLGIPTNPSFGSLNIASAVQLIAYDWREAIGGYEV